MKNNYKSYDYIVNKYKNLVYYLARRLYQKSDFDDLVQAGFMGLLKASNNFDFTKSENFKNYASKYIIYEMKKELRNKNLIHVSDYFYKIKNKINKEKINDILELSEKTNISLENIILAGEQKVIFDDEQINNYLDCTNKKFLVYLSKEEIELYNLRVKNNLNQKEISEYLKVSQSSISRRLEKLKQKINELK